MIPPLDLPMDALSSPPVSPIAPATTIAAAGQNPLAYRLTMLREAVVYLAFAILWLFGYARVRLSLRRNFSCLPSLPVSLSLSFPMLTP